MVIREKALSPDHPDMVESLNNLGGRLRAQGDIVGAQRYFERALLIVERALGAVHPTTKTVANNMASVLEALKRRKEAKALRKKFDVEG